MSTPGIAPASTALNALIRQAGSPWRMNIFFLSRLPSLWWWGVRVRQLSVHSCQTTIPYSWRTQNPFRSTYFAAQAGAAELSTGLMALLAVHSQPQPVSMLITGMKGEFIKKATSTITFTCQEGQLIQEAVQQALLTGQPQVVTINTQGVQASGELVSSFAFTWSFKTKG